MLISEQYRALNSQLHADEETYGTSACQWAPKILELCQGLRTHNVLDYGCGKRSLEQSLGWDITNYDPCIPGLDSPPEPHDVVACLDVLEHIEPEYLDAVLDDLQRVTRLMGFFLVAMRPAKKTLADGRNAHLIQEGPEFWLPKITQRWHLASFREVFQPHDPIIGRAAAFMVAVRSKDPEIGDLRRRG